MNEKIEMINHPGQWLYDEGCAYWNGSDFKKKDVTRGKLMIVASASAGFPMAIANCYYEGWNGLKQDFEKALDEFVKIEKDTNGYQNAQFMIGWCYKNGIGIEKDMNKAVEWYIKSVEQRNSVATLQLALCYIYGEGVGMDIPKGFELFEQSALLGHSMGMYSVGINYQSGQSVPVDMNKAKEWFAKAAAQGNTDAQTMLVALNAERHKDTTRDTKIQIKN